MKNYVILSEKIWHRILPENLSRIIPANWILIDRRENFVKDKLVELEVDKIGIAHWSYIIPKEIYESFECILFHMTDLPYGRGGSPLQNLIVRGHEETKISALRVVQELDAGDIYLKKELSLQGTAQEIFLRASKIIEKMIAKILQHHLTPQKQEGEEVVFKRRKPKDGNIESLEDLEKVYDYIRMLDADTYPNAFVELQNFRLEFFRASLQADQSIIADVRIIPK